MLPVVERRRGEGSPPDSCTGARMVSRVRGKAGNLRVVVVVLAVVRFTVPLVGRVPGKIYSPRGAFRPVGDDMLNGACSSSPGNGWFERVVARACDVTGRVSGNTYTPRGAVLPVGEETLSGGGGTFSYPCACAISALPASSIKPSEAIARLCAVLESDREVKLVFRMY